MIQDFIAKAVVVSSGQWLKSDCRLLSSDCTQLMCECLVSAEWQIGDCEVTVTKGVNL